MLAPSCNCRVIAQAVGLRITNARWLEGFFYDSLVGDRHAGFKRSGSYKGGCILQGERTITPDFGIDLGGRLGESRFPF